MPNLYTPTVIILTTAFSILALSFLCLAIYLTLRTIRTKRDAILREQRRRNEMRSLAVDIFNAQMMVLESITGRDVELGELPKAEGLAGEKQGQSKQAGGRGGEEHVCERRGVPEEEELEGDGDGDGDADVFQEVGFDWISMRSRNSVELDLEDGQWTEIDLTRGDEEEVEPPSREQTRSPRVWVTMEPPRGMY